MYNFPKPSQLPKPTIDETKVENTLRFVAKMIEVQNKTGRKEILANLTDGLNDLETDKVVGIIKSSGYNVQFMGLYKISWSN